MKKKLKKWMSLFAVLLTAALLFGACELSPGVEQEVLIGEDASTQSGDTENEITRGSTTITTSYGVRYQKEFSWDDFATVYANDEASNGEAAGPTSNNGIVDVRINKKLPSGAADSHFDVVYEVWREGIWAKGKNGSQAIWISENLSYTDDANLKGIKILKVYLEGPDSNKYSVKYQVRGLNGEWSGWKWNGTEASISGTFGHRQFTSIKVLIFKKEIHTFTITDSLWVKAQATHTADFYLGIAPYSPSTGLSSNIHLKAEENQQIVNGTLNLYEFFKARGKELVPGNWYKVKVTTADGIAIESKIIQFLPPAIHDPTKIEYYEHRITTLTFIMFYYYGTPYYKCELYDPFDDRTYTYEGLVTPTDDGPIGAARRKKEALTNYHLRQYIC